MYTGETAKAYASKSEKMLIELGLPVVRPPESKVVEKQTSNVDVATTKKSADYKIKSDEVNKGKLSTGELTETYVAYEATAADYIFLLIRNQGLLKL